jgi:hypothetical protein
LGLDDEFEILVIYNEGKRLFGELLECIHEQLAAEHHFAFSLESVHYDGSADSDFAVRGSESKYVLVQFKQDASQNRDRGFGGDNTTEGLQLGKQPSAGNFKFHILYRYLVYVTL